MSLKEWKQSLKKSLREELYPHGYRVKGNVFVKENDEAMSCIAVQSSKYTSQQEFEFTVNLGVVLKRLSMLPHWICRYPGMLVGPFGCHFSERIGLLMDSADDHWWVITSDDELEIAAKEVVRLLRERVTPRLEQLASEDALLELWRRGVGASSVSVMVQNELRRYLEDMKQ